MPTFPPGATESATPYPWGKKYEITIPAWNDIIHFSVPPTWSKQEMRYMIDADFYTRILGLSIDEASVRSGRDFYDILNDIEQYKEYNLYKQRIVETAQALRNSPTPEIAQNFGVIMTAIDDVQDFMTTVGVVARVLGRVYPPLDKLAVGAFTVGELLNKLSALNNLTGGEKAVVCRLVRDLKKTSTKTTIKADVSKRMKRLYPSKGEALEVLQTTDQLFGVGVSFGPLVGLALDAFFGAQVGAPTRFKTWVMTETEKKAILDAVYSVIGPGEHLRDYEIRMLKEYESSSLALLAGKYLDWVDYANALALQAEAAFKLRGERLNKAIANLWEMLERKRAVPPKKTSTETRLLIQSLGGDPYAQDAWPVEGLGADATLQELMDAMSSQANKTLQSWRNKLGDSDQGLFLDASVKAISTDAVEYFTSDGGSYSESLATEPLIFIHALEAGLNPPPHTSIEKFTEWMNYIKSDMEYFSQEAPTTDLLQSANSKFFPSP